MKNTNLPGKHAHSLLEDAKKWDLPTWNKEIQHIDSKLVSDFVPAASIHFDPLHWKDKLHILIHKMSDPADLESAAKMLSLEQLHEILYLAFQKDANITPNKLSSLFVGISQRLFYGLVVRISPEQLSVLRHEAAAESIQHHLSILSHEIKQKFDRLCDQITLETSILNAIKFKGMGLDDINGIYGSLNDLHHQALEIVHVTERALALAWNTNRMDIIQELSSTKELCRHCIANDIGSPSANGTSAAGLWLVLENRVNQLFSEEASGGFFTRIKDTDPAIEALVKFSIWYLKDYYEVGLLPSSTKADLEKLDSATSTDEVQLKKKETLFSLAEQNLLALELKTLADLKKHHIYSRQALVDFITKTLS